MASTNSQTPSSSTSSSTPTKWDVFLSFRGIDTRYTFTSHLYSALDRYSIRTFMDDPELQSGEVISDALLQAIQKSKIYIVVLSENYASSRWCLDELVEILSCSSTMERLVIPVFYNIDPSVVRRQTASFEKHFEEHEVRFSGEIERVKKWRQTLRQVADKSGKHVDGKSTIQQRLMISLNALESDDPLLKKMFLDIACFFIGRKKEQDVGKEIARNNSPDEPGKYSRLWIPKDVCYVLEEHKGTEAIEGIMHHPFYKLEDLDVPFKEVLFAMETFRRMSKLRFLSFDGINFTGKFERTLEDLRWFCWKGCPLKCLPFDFRPQKIVILELPYSKMTTMWEVNKVPKALENLKTLNMSFSRDLTTTPDFRRLPCLRKLNFDGCTSLKEVHNSIGSLVSLVSLNLKDCKNLRSLPDTICNLRALEVICIQGCTMLEALPIQLGNIKSLKELDAEGLAVLKLPDSIGNLSKLVKLNLNSNQELECLPDTICNLRALEFLSIENCTKVGALPVELGNIESLKEFRVSNLPISKLPDSICNMRSLEILDISGCDKLETLPDQLWKLTGLLMQLDLSGAALSLTQLDLSESKITALPSGISLLSNLKKLELSYCDRLLSIAELPPNLTVIRADFCTSLERINLSNLKHLEEFGLIDCSGLKEILGLGDLNSLKRMDLFGCPSSLLALTFTEPLFQIYSGFEQEITFHLQSERFPDWIIQSSVASVQTFSSDDLPKEFPPMSSTVNLLPNLSHNYLGMILCFNSPFRGLWGYADYSVMTSASNILTDEEFDGPRIVIKPSIIIIPRSIFSVTDADHTIKFTSNANGHRIRLLYKNEDDSTTVNVEDERSNSI